MDSSSRYLGELLESAALLDQLDDAAPAEAWASGAVAEWVAIGGNARQLAGRVWRDHDLAAALIDWVCGGKAPSAGPDWVSDVGTHRAVRSCRLDAGRETALIIDYVAQSGAGHSTSMSIVDGRAVELTIGPEDLVEATIAAEEFDVEMITTDVATADASAALEATGPDDLSDDARLNLAVFSRRLDIDVDLNDLLAPVEEATDGPAPELAREPDDDRYAAGVIRGALRPRLDDDPPPAVEAARKEFGRRLQTGDPDATSLVVVAGLEKDDFDETGPAQGEFLRCVGAYMAPQSLDPHDPHSQSAIATLEWADWLGAVLGVVRAGSGEPVDGTGLVRHVNRCPEITTQIPERDRAAIAWAFDEVLYSWQVTGVIDDRSLLTEAGVWLLPRAALEVWDS